MLGRAERGPSVSTAHCPLSRSVLIVSLWCFGAEVILVLFKSSLQKHGLYQRIEDGCQVSSCDLLNSALTMGGEVFEGKREFFGLLSGK